MPNPLVFGYFLGVWLIGPFVSYGDCDNARNYQLEAGAAPPTEISVCYAFHKVDWPVTEFHVPPRAGY